MIYDEREVMVCNKFITNLTFKDMYILKKILNHKAIIGPYHMNEKVQIATKNPLEYIKKLTWF